MNHLFINGDIVQLVQAACSPLHGPVHRAELDQFDHDMAHPAAVPLLVNSDINLQTFSFERTGNNPNCYTHGMSVTEKLAGCAEGPLVTEDHHLVLVAGC